MTKKLDVGSSINTAKDTSNATKFNSFSEFKDYK